MSQLLLKTEIRSETDIVWARKKARDISEFLGFDLQEQTRVATAVSEIARNAYQYAKTGMIEFSIIQDEQIKLLITVKDRGPGIGQLKEILGGTYVSPQGMGVGVIGAKRLMDDLTVETSSEGTQIQMLKVVPHKKKLLSTAELNALMDRIVRTHDSSLVDEIQKQNQEILLTVQALNEKKEELTRLNQELEDTNRGVVALYAELDEKAEILKTASETKTRFLSDMTHEFRSPLNSIMSISQILFDEAKEENNLERQKQVSFILKAGKGLSDLVNDLLDIAKIEAGKIPVRTTTFTVDEIFSTLRGLMRPVGFGTPQVQLNFSEVPEDWELSTDEGKVAQILRNLISNALKYTEEGEVRVSARKTERDSICFCVKDTGIGIEDKDLANIFEEFYQVEHSLQKRHRGTGLGLPLAKKLAVLLGGNLWVESEVGKGSTFSVEVPLIYGGPQDASYESPVRSAKVPQAQGEDGGKTILYVDDDEANRYNLRKALQDSKLELVTASSGREGLDYLSKDTPDLIILDLIMPEMDGFAFIKACLEREGTREIPIILYTSKDLEKEEYEYFKQVTAGIVRKHETSETDIKEAVADFFK